MKGVHSDVIILLKGTCIGREKLIDKNNTFLCKPTDIQYNNIPIQLLRGFSGTLVHRLINPLNPELNPICYLLALLGAHYFLHVSRIRVKSLTLRRLMSYISGAPILDVSRSHTTTQHNR